ncbi:hypothetical protein OsI_02781 [Oryza sativa Indica Group]|uniref:Uncharacterized protein n=1 Tax=Oryza sativa subsp. indica TaxID=39946 RepID=B8ABJ1_ORYSI|nr:hypothetical protein OsI_02781 [Oryza sativa Indica Group]
MHLASAEFFLALIRPPTPPPVTTATEVNPSPLPPPSSSTPPSPSIGTAVQVPSCITPTSPFSLYPTLITRLLR